MSIKEDEAEIKAETESDVRKTTRIPPYSPTRVGEAQGKFREDELGRKPEGTDSQRTIRRRAEENRLAEESANPLQISNEIWLIKVGRQWLGDILLDGKPIGVFEVDHEFTDVAPILRDIELGLVDEHEILKAQQWTLGEATFIVDLGIGSVRHGTVVVQL